MLHAALTESLGIVGMLLGAVGVVFGLYKGKVTQHDQSMEDRVTVLESQLTIANTARDAAGERLLAERDRVNKADRELLERVIASEQEGTTAIIGATRALDDNREAVLETRDDYRRLREMLEACALRCAYDPKLAPSDEGNDP